jgi:hypothetical protein
LMQITYSCKSQTKHKTIEAYGNLSVTCQSEKQHSYALYIPSHDSTCSSLPLLIVLDPHGSGSSVINRFKPLSEKFKIIIAASNLIKNNYPDFNQSILNLVQDVKNKYGAGNTLYISGFSGGARMAIAYAQSNKTDGIMACGALAQKDELIKCNTTIYSIMGMSDFNFPEIAQFIFAPETKPKNLSLEIAGEIHEWPDSSVLLRGIGYLLYNTVKEADCISSNKLIVEELENTFLARATDFKKEKEFIKAKLLYDNLSESKIHSQKKLIKEKLDSLLNCSDYKYELEQFKKTLAFEMKLREAYYNTLIKNDDQWWDQEIKNLNLQMEKTNNKYELLVYKRIKAYLGILCYSLTRNSFSNNDFAYTEKILHVYKLIEPHNADMFFYSAVLNLKKGNNAGQIKALFDSAIKNGFTDTLLINQYFPKN